MKFFVEEGYSNVSIMYIDTSGAVSASGALSDLLNEVDEVDYTRKRVRAQAGSYQGEFQQFVEADPDFFVFSGGEASFKVALRDYVDLGIDIPIITNIYCLELVIDNVGADLMQGAPGYEFGLGP